VPKFYVLEKVEAHKQGRRSEYHRLIARVYADNLLDAVAQAREKYGEKVTVQRANGGYEEGR